MQSALLIAGISTLIQLISFKYTIGSGLPVIIGVSFAYLASLQGIAEQFDLATLFGAQLASSLAAILVGIFIKRLGFLFPPSNGDIHSECRDCGDNQGCGKKGIL